MTFELELREQVSSQLLAPASRHCHRVASSTGGAGKVAPVPMFTLFHRSNFWIQMRFLVLSTSTFIFCANNFQGNLQKLLLMLNTKLRPLPLFTKNIKTDYMREKPKIGWFKTKILKWCQAEIFAVNITVFLFTHHEFLKNKSTICRGLGAISTDHINSSMQIR